jgi:excisionase family DNA binding protein
MKTKKLKGILILTLQQIQQTNELLSSLVVAIKDMENKPPPFPVIAETEKHPELLSVKMAMQYTGYSRSYIYKLVHWSKITYHKPTGGRLFFKKSELEEFLLRGKKAADYEVSAMANDILNTGEIKRSPVHRRKPQKRP